MELKIVYRNKKDADCVLDGKKLSQEAFGLLYFGNREDVLKVFGEEKPTLVFEKAGDDGNFDEVAGFLQWVINNWYDR